MLLFVIVRTFLCLVSLGDGTSNIISDQYEYIIKQDQYHSNGSLYLYVPYILWSHNIYSSSKTLSTPLELRSVNGLLDITLFVRSARITTEAFSYNTRAFCVDTICSVPGPTLYCSPGDNVSLILNLNIDSLLFINIQVKINLINMLEDIPGYSWNRSGRGNGLRYPNRTNLFFHGLHIDPKINNPYRFNAGGGKSLLYEFNIEKDASPGLNWYHSRVHGYSAMHVMGGLFGAVMVNPSSPMTDFPQALSAMSRSLLVMSHIFLDSNFSDPFSLPKDSSPPSSVSSPLLPFSHLDGEYGTSSLSLTFLSEDCGSSIPIQPRYYSIPNVNGSQKILNDIWMVNGHYQPTLVMQPGEWRIWDILAASGDRILEIEIKPYLSNPNLWNDDFSCDLKLVAFDGVYLGSPRTGIYVKHLTLLQAARASLAVQCNTTGIFYVQTVTTFNDSSPYFGIGEDQTKSVQLLLFLSVEGDFIDYMEPPPQDLSSIQRPKRYEYLNNKISNIDNYTFNGSSRALLSLSTAQLGASLNETPSQPCSSNDTLFWIGLGEDCSLPCYDDTLCEALYGAIVPTVLQFPTVRDGKCNYSTYSPNSIECNQEKLFSVPLGLIDIEVCAYTSSPIPTFLQSTRLQYIIGRGELNADIMTADQYSGLGHLADPANFGNEGDIRDVWPAFVGCSFFRTILSDFSGPMLVLSHFLKFEDAGYINAINVSDPTFSADGLVSKHVELSNISSQTSSIFVTTDSPPEKYSENPSSSPVNYTCDVNGMSWLYAEVISIDQSVRKVTFNSCPNHFSVCQSNECAGERGVSRALINTREIILPLFPRLSSSAPLDTTCSREMVGIAFNGVGIYSAADSKGPSCSSSSGLARNPSKNFSDAVFGRTSCILSSGYGGISYCGDILLQKQSVLDMCGGYADERGVYKYHIPPTCLLLQLSSGSYTKEQVYSANPSIR